MPQIAFMTLHDRTPWLRQTPGGDGDWHGWRYRLNDAGPGADWLVVYDELKTAVVSDLPRDRRALVITEPPGIKVYRPGFLRQFGLVISPVAIAGFQSRQIVSDVGHPWQIGLDMTSTAATYPSRWDWAGLRDLPLGIKHHRLSAVISTKSWLPKHRARVDFVRALADRLGDRFDLLGRGFREIDDKAEAILPYSHHLVIENNDEDGFFTEKITDSYLGWALPIFSGCRDIERYFPADSMVRFDLAAPDAIERVIAALDAPVDARRLAAIAEARVAVMDRANIFARLTDVLGRLDATPPVRAPAPLHPNEAFAPLTKRLKVGWRRLKRRIFPK
ncbi:hypothetical protein [Siculibacillus lacustris]|uniref:hypothetical protein n=1 Tax=Siculibacillus lacustris TaxID=1549641 RepID=UPI0013F171AD|nr:hypothetical protein [Siculibacillus lacustris]